jgi:competence protein ComFC
MILDMYRYIKGIGQLFQSSIFQVRCRLCENDLVYDGEYAICNSCKNEIRPIHKPVCCRCGTILENRSNLCGNCILQPPEFKKHISYAFYEGNIRDLILLYKYREVEPLKNLLAKYYLELFERNFNERFDFIIPVPPDKERKREFNPILEIARILSKKSGIKLHSRNLVKVKKTPPQVGLSKAERIRNLDGAFKLKDPKKIKNKKILLIDDVFTTGTTIKKCSSVLKRKGATVNAMTLARSVSLFS